MIWVAVGLIIIIFIAVKITTRKRCTVEQVTLSHGNVSVFMDNRGKIDVIPFNLDRFKRGKASDYPLMLMKPYSPESVGALIRRGLVLSGNEKSLTDKDLMEALGFYDWKEYSKGRKSVSVTCRKQEVALNSTIHRSDGAYSFRVRGFEKVLPADLSNHELGYEALKMMKLSV